MKKALIEGSFDPVVTLFIDELFKSILKYFSIWKALLRHLILLYWYFCEMFNLMIYVGYHLIEHC